jgi:hypothetical protein
LSGRCEEEKNLAPAGNRTLTMQPIAHHCTDRAILTHKAYEKTIFHEVCFLYKFAKRMM